MKIIIDIPDEIYNTRVNLVNYFGCYSDKLDKIIYNGTPLPKGHGRLKDVSELSYECMYENSSECDHRMCDTCQFNCVAKYEIVDAPTIIEADGGGANV